MSPKLREVVDYFIVKSKETSRPLTNKKLQKLIYYAQAWNLAFTGKKLFDDPIEAWIHGPVVPEVYQAYRKYGKGAITEDATFDESLFTKEEIDTLNEVWDTYGKFDGNYLEALTHSEDPWINARGDAEVNDRLTEEIEPEAMRVFYCNLLSSTKGE